MVAACLQIDGQAVSPDELVKVELTAGVHTLEFFLDLTARKHGLRVELVQVPGSKGRAQVVGGP